MKFPSLPIYLKAESLGRLTLFRIPNFTLLFQDFDKFAVRTAEKLNENFIATWIFRCFRF